MPSLRNIIIFIVIVAVLGAGWYFFSNSGSTPSLVTSGASPDATNGGTTTPDSSITSTDFLSLLLNVQNIKLDDRILNDPVFQNLHDSSIPLVQDVTAGRPNPFAPIGSDQTEATLPTCTAPQVLDPATSSCVSPTPPASTNSSSKDNQSTPDSQSAPKTDAGTSKDTSKTKTTSGTGTSQ